MDGADSGTIHFFVFFFVHKVVKIQNFIVISVTEWEPLNMV